MTRTSPIDAGDTSGTSGAGAGVGAGAGADAARGTPIDDEGNDDPEDPGHGALPSSGRFEKVGTPPLALSRICDLTPLGDALYAAHANQPLGTDGATITRYRPDDARPFSVAFDWNRHGEPAKGGGAGQGFVRVRAIDGRLFVADADPPYNGLGLVDYGTEGYVFVSDRAGRFAPPRAPHFRPPGAPDLLGDAGGGAGAGVLPRAYHVIDVVKLRGALYASTGSVPPKERAWRGPSPGALHRANESGSRWTYEVDYPYPWRDGVWRLTFLVRFRDRLYAGIQDYDGREPNDYVYFAPGSAGVAGDGGARGDTGARGDAGEGSGTGTGTGTGTGGDGGAITLGREDAHGVRVTRGGAAGTLRWWVDARARPARLYWIAWSGEGVVLRLTSDGDRWASVALPEGAGRPTDVTRFRDGVVVLTERGLYSLSGAAVDGASGVVAQGGVAEATASVIARVGEGPDGGPAPKNAKSPFEVSDSFCVAPLAVFRNELFAGGQRGGSLYRLVE